MYTGKRFGLASGERGFSLIELMVVAAISSIMALGMAQLITNSQRGVVSVSRRDEFNDFKRLIAMTGQTTAGCRAMLGIGEPPVGVEISAPGTAGSVTTFNTLNLGSGQVVADAAGTGNHLFGGIYLNDLSILKDGTTFSPDNWSARLVIVADRSAPGTAPLPGGQMRAEMPMVISDTNADGSADSCSILGESEPSSEPELVVGQTGPVDCEGTTGATIQSCLNMVTATRRSVLIKAGTYTAVNNMIVPAGVVVRGEPGTILQGSVAGSMFSITGPSNAGVIIKDLAFTLGTATRAIAASNVNNLRVEGNQFNNTANATGIGVQVSCVGCNGVIIEKNRFGNPVTNFLGTGVSITSTGSSRDIFIQDNMARAGGAAAFRFDVDGTTNNIRVLNNSIVMTGASTMGVDLDLTSTARGVIINNNTIEAVAAGVAASRGVRVNGTGYLDTLNLESNSIKMGSSGGIPLFIGTLNSADLSIQNNALHTNASTYGFYRGGAGGPYSTGLMHFSKNGILGRIHFENMTMGWVTIQNNTADLGLTVNNGTVVNHGDVIIQGNNLRRTGTLPAIQFTASSGSSLSRSMISNNIIGSPGIHLAGIVMSGVNFGGDISSNEVRCSSGIAAVPSSSADAYASTASYRTNAPSRSGIYLDGAVSGSRIKIADNNITACAYGIAVPFGGGPFIQGNKINEARVGIAADVMTSAVTYLSSNISGNTVKATIPFHIIGGDQMPGAPVQGNTFEMANYGGSTCGALGTGAVVCNTARAKVVMTGNVLRGLNTGEACFLTGAIPGNISTLFNSTVRDNALQCTNQVRAVGAATPIGSIIQKIDINQPVNECARMYYRQSVMLADGSMSPALGMGINGSSWNGSGNFFLGCPFGYSVLSFSVNCGSGDFLATTAVQREGSFHGVRGDCGDPGAGSDSTINGGSVMCCMEGI